MLFSLKQASLISRKKAIKGLVFNFIKYWQSVSENFTASWKKEKRKKEKIAFPWHLCRWRARENTYWLSLQWAKVGIFEVFLVFIFVFLCLYISTDMNSTNVLGNVLVVSFPFLKELLQHPFSPPCAQKHLSFSCSVACGTTTQALVWEPRDRAWAFQCRR